MFPTDKQLVPLFGQENELEESSPFFKAEMSDIFNGEGLELAKKRIWEGRSERLFLLFVERGKSKFWNNKEESTI